MWHVCVNRYAHTCSNTCSYRILAPCWRQRIPTQYNTHDPYIQLVSKQIVHSCSIACCVSACLRVCVSVCVCVCVGDAGDSRQTEWDKRRTRATRAIFLATTIRHHTCTHRNCVREKSRRLNQMKCGDDEDFRSWYYFGQPHSHKHNISVNCR